LDLGLLADDVGVPARILDEAIGLELLDLDLLAERAAAYEVVDSPAENDAEHDPDDDPEWIHVRSLACRTLRRRPVEPPGEPRAEESRAVAGVRRRVAEPIGRSDGYPLLSRAPVGARTVFPANAAVLAANW